MVTLDFALLHDTFSWVMIDWNATTLHHVDSCANVLTGFEGIVKLTFGHLHCLDPLFFLFLD